MTKENWLSLLRSLVLVIISYLVGHRALNHTLDQNLLETVGESVIGLATAIWGVFDKSAGIEQLQSALRSLATIVFTTLATWGLLSGQTAIALIGFTTTLLPFVQSVVSKAKVKQLDSGKLQTTSTGKVVKAGPKVPMMIIVLCLLSLAGSAQTIFQPVPKITKPEFKVGVMGIAVPVDSFQNLLRPTVVASISFPGSVAQGGVGFAYQHMRYDYTNLRWQSLYSFGLYGLGGVNTTGSDSTIVSPKPPTSLKGIVSASLLFGFAGDALRFGPQYNFQVPPGYKTHWALSLVWGINFNN